MSFEYKVRRYNFTKEHEVVNKISKLLKVLTNDGRKMRPGCKKEFGEVPMKKFSVRNKSFCPRVTIFDFVSAKLVKPPAFSNPILPELGNSPTKNTKEHAKTVKKRVQTYILPCALPKKPSHTCTIQNTDRFKRILNLTEELINKENLGGWNDNSL